MAVYRIVVIFLVMSLYGVQGQEDRSCDGTTRGRHFAVAFTGNYEGDVTVIELSLLVVASSSSTTTVTVNSQFQINGIPFQETFEIQPRGFHRVSIPSEFALGTTSELSIKVIEIIATSDVSVYGLNYAPHTTDAFLGIPVDHLGLIYVVMSYEQYNLFPTVFAVVGVEDSTMVAVTLTGDVTLNGLLYTSGDLLEFTVNRNEVVQVVANSGFDDIGGSIIQSDKPVAVFSGDLCAKTAMSYCDVLSEQVVPVKNWGTKHIYTATGSPEGRSTYVVHAYYEDTKVYVSRYSPFTMQPGEVRRITRTGSGVIRTSQPTSVVQVLYKINGNYVDPSLIQIPTENQFGYNFGFSTPPKAGGSDDGFYNFLNIIIKINESDTVTVNNEPIHDIDGMSSHPIPNTDYEVFIIEVPKGEGVYFVEQTLFQIASPISVVVYGYEDDESYGYSAGLSLPRDRSLVSTDPFFLREVGGEQLTISLPCMKSDIEDVNLVYCRFHANTKPSDVKGIFTGTNTVMCVSPLFEVTGFVKFELSIDNKKTFPFRGNVYVASQHVLPPKLSVKQIGSQHEDLINATKSDGIITFDWNQNDFPNTESVDVSVMFATIDGMGDQIEWSDEVDVVNDIPNTGAANVRSDAVSDAAQKILVDRSGAAIVIFSLKSNLSLRKRRSPLTFLLRLAFRSKPLIYATPVVLATECFTWQIVLMFTKATNIPPCPCTTEQAGANVGDFEPDENSLMLNFFHPGASACYRSRNNDISGQQCCYGSDGNILVGPPGGGTADSVAPNGISPSTFEHLFLDVVPYLSCCKLSNNCDTYYKYRPSDDCSDYDPPNPTGGRGDPHFTSLDGKEFTFNGVGEFLLLESPLFNVTFQARMEILPGTNASVYSAFVLTSNSSDKVQIQRSTSNETIILINGLPINLRQDGFIIRKQVHKGLHVSLNTELTKIHIHQNSGLSLSIRITDEMMSFILQLPNIFQNETQGLLGNFNSNPDDDFMLPNGSFLSPNLTLAEIHYDFGLSWILNATTSLFTYIPPNDFSTFNHPSFKPTFPDLNQVSNDIKEICGGSNQCLFDALSTNSTRFANDTLLDVNTFDIIKNHSVKIISCGFPGKVSRGFVNGSIYLVGYRISISCEDDWYLDGPVDLVCGENGTWSDVLPSCNPCVTPSTTLTLTENAKALKCMASIVWNFMWWYVGF